MKKIAVLLFVLLIPTFVSAEVEKIQVDTSTSEIKWLGKKVSGQHDGTIKLKDGFIEVKDGNISGGSFTIDMLSIVNKDIESPKYKAKLEDHLKSNDFFNVSKFAEAKFDIASVSKADNGKFEVEGTLDVKGIKKPVKFLADITEAEGKKKAVASFNINRLDWDIKYNSGKFFSIADLGDKLIYDDIGISLSLVTK